MATAPAFQFYANDFIAGTQDLSAEEVGIYMRLLCYQWDKGHLPSDENRLSRIAGCDILTFKKAWVFLGFKFSVNNGEFIQNPRLEKTREEQEAFRVKQRLNGSKGGRPKKIETQTITQTKPKQNPNHNPNETSSSSSSIRYINISFSVFWDLYDKKVGDKEKIESKWNKLSNEERELIQGYIPKYIESQPSKKYRKDPLTFLNNKSWNDEIIGDDLFTPKSGKDQKIQEGTAESIYG
jgi:uncharacterized protein YdaU (DUF1376 family)